MQPKIYQKIIIQSNLARRTLIESFQQKSRIWKVRRDDSHHLALDIIKKKDHKLSSSSITVVIFVFIEYLLINFLSSAENSLSSVYVIPAISIGMSRHVTRIEVEQVNVNAANLPINVEIAI